MQICIGFALIFCYVSSLECLSIWIFSDKSNFLIDMPRRFRDFVFFFLPAPAGFRLWVFRWAENPCLEPASRNCRRDPEACLFRCPSFSFFCLRTLSFLSIPMDPGYFRCHRLLPQNTRFPGSPVFWGNRCIDASTNTCSTVPPRRTQNGSQLHQ